MKIKTIEKKGVKYYLYAIGGFSQMIREKYHLKKQGLKTTLKQCSGFGFNYELYINKKL